MNSTQDAIASTGEHSANAPVVDIHTPGTRNNVRTTWAAIALAVVLLLWAGMVINNAFVAGVKFATPSMTRAVGMDVGRTIFSAFNKVELVCCLLTFCLVLPARPFHRVPKLVGVLLALVWLTVGLQTAFLLPMLIERALLFIQGQPLPNSPLHRLYSSSELLKIFSLITLGVCIIRQFGSSGNST